MRLGHLVLASLTMLTFSACMHDFELAIDKRGEGQKGEPDSSAVKPGREASTEPSTMEAGTDSAVDAGVDASLAPAYRWVANGPPAQAEEGPASFTLTCVDPEGRPAECAFRCSLNGERALACSNTREVSWVHAGPQLDPRAHEFCVTAQPASSDAGAEAAAELGSTVCHRWVAIPYQRAFTWIDQPLASLSTEIDVALSCSQPLVGGGTSAPRTDCNFRCSVDGIPYEYYAGRFTHRNLAPGPHVLRIEATGPSGTFEAKLARVTTKAFTVASGATPAVVAQPLTLPPVLSREELESSGLAQLLDPYGVFATACRNDALTEAPKHADRLREYLSYGLGSTSAGTVRVAVPEQIAACLTALKTVPAPCRLLPGFSTSYLEDGPLAVRLPEACAEILAGEQPAGAPCYTHADCRSATCERSEAWVPPKPSSGFCTDSSFPEYREGIMCRSRGCDSGVYCDGRVCALLRKPGETCVRSRQATDCPETYTCSGSPSRCVLANARLGDACSFDRDCAVGHCGRDPQVCVAD